MNRKHDGLFAFIITLAAVAALTGIGLILPGKDLSLPTETGIREEVFVPPAAEISAEPEEAAANVFVGFTAPLSGIITSPYGYRTDPFSGQTSYHRGVDIGVKEGTDVLACAAGKVTVSEFNSVGGNYVIIDHGGGQKSYYGHLQTRLVSAGDDVAHGQVIGLSGATGMVTGPHLHFQLFYRDRTVDPTRYVSIVYEN